MALGDVGMFLPTESQFREPGAYTAALRAEALKRAAYLSQMDEFYTQLEEARRQYDQTLAWQKEALAKEIAFKEWAKKEDVKIEEKSLGLQRELGMRSLDLQEKGLAQKSGDTYRTDWLAQDVTSRALNAGESYRRGLLDLGERKMSTDQASMDAYAMMIQDMINKRQMTRPEQIPIGSGPVMGSPMAYDMTQDPYYQPGMQNVIDIYGNRSGVTQEARGFEGGSMFDDWYL